MSPRYLTAGVLALALSSCAWLPWNRPHRQPPPRAPAETVSAVPTPAPAATRPPPSASTVEKPRPSRSRPVVSAVRPTGEAPAPPATTRQAAAPAEATAAAVKHELRGRVQLKAGRGQQVQPGEAVDTVVWFVPAGGMPAPAPRQADIVTTHRDFQPTAIAVPLGSTISFVNRDKVRHNVFSVTPGAEFNLGYQAAGKSADHVFAAPGLVLISCNVHHTMEMDVFVVPSPYAGQPAADGSFVLRGLPVGPGELLAWSPRARLVRQKVELPAPAPVSLLLLAERPRVVTDIDVGERP